MAEVSVSASSLPTSPAPMSPPRSAKPESGRPPNRSNSFLLIFGVILPVVTLTIEFLTHQCAGEFFDPLPTWWHVALVALVPLVNFGVWLAAKRQTCARPRTLAHLNALAIGIAAAYTLAFVPLMPLAVIALAFVGWGMLPLTPVLALIAAVFARRTLGRVPGVTLPPVWIGVVTALGIFALGLGHKALTSHGLRMATSGDERADRAGLQLLRTFGDKEYLLSACYGNRGGRMFGTGWFGTDFPVSTEVAQQAFYRVTGQPYNSLPAPTSAGLARGRGSWNFDAGIGGTSVADKVPGLSMTASRLDGKVDTVGNSSYTEWTLVFKNVARNASEARAQIELPPGGVVSRLTLWINGEPREAAFGGRSQVRAAYQEVAVAQRRDPVLVTTSGPNRVLMQCFPVPPNGGEMKVRVGITAPLRLVDERRAQIALPRFLEVNFEQSDRFRHDLWLEGDAAIATAGQDGGKKHQTRLSSAELQRGPALLTGRGATGETWAEDPTDAAFVIRQTVRPRPVAAPRQVAFVVDGSRAMRGYLQDFARALATLPAGQRFAIFYAGDEVEKWDGQTGPPAAQWLAERALAGGRDNLPALLRAWDEATQAELGAVVWIHGPQPVALSPVEPLVQRFERDHTPPAFYDLPTEPGPNRPLEALASFQNLQAINFGGTPGDDLRHLIGLWSGRAVEFIAERERLPRPASLENLAKADRHVARLWGHEEVERLRLAPDPGSLDRAIQLALKLQLVTPVSGAVVLETQEQYDRHGLKPGDPAASPVVPEPATALLLAGSAALWLGTRRRRTAVA